MYIYLLRCADDSLYTGIAIDMNKRIRQHLGEISGGAKYTRSHKVTYIEAIWEVMSAAAARKIEYTLKRQTHLKKEQLINKPWEISEL